MLKELNAKVGWRMKTMVMNEMDKFRVISGTHFLLTNFMIIHIKVTIRNRINGRTDSKNSLKIEFDSKCLLISISEIKQSNDKNVCFGSPTLNIGLNERIRLSGNLSSNEKEAVTNCK